MAEAVVTMNPNAKGTALDPSRLLRAYHKGQAVFLDASNDVLSAAINIKQFSSVGLLLPGFATTAKVQVLVSDEEDGTYFLLPFDSGVITAAKATEAIVDILAYPFMKIQLDVTEPSDKTIKFTLS